MQKFGISDVTKFHARLGHLQVDVDARLGTGMQLGASDSSFLF